MARKAQAQDDIATTRNTPAAGAAANIIAQPIDVLPPRRSKIELVIELLRREEGASLAHLTEATGWQAHSVRAALTGLKQKGHALVRAKHEGAAIYHIAPADAGQ